MAVEKVCGCATLSLEAGRLRSAREVGGSQDDAGLKLAPSALTSLLFDR